MRLRSYQHEAVKRTKEVFKTSQSALISLCTGGGKTVIFSHIAKDTEKRVMIMAHRGELIHQAANKIELITGKAADIEMASDYANRLYKNDVVVATVQTLISGRYEHFNPDEFGLLVVDEAHHACAKSYRQVIDHFKSSPGCKILGVTATPDRTDEKALGMVFENVSFEYDICDGISDGWLVPIEQNEVFVEGLDFSACKTAMGDLANNEVAAIMEFERNLHEVASSTIQIARGRKTLIFAASVAQAERTCEILNRHESGCADYVTGKTAKDVRSDMFKNYARKRFQFLVNVGVATEGFDDPGVEVVAIARPTKSRCLYAQMAGRGTRPAEDIAYQLNECDDSAGRRDMILRSMKPNVEIIDFVGNAGRHKLVNSADILGGKYDDDILDMAKAEISRKAKTGETTEIMSELKKAEAEMARRRHDQIEAAKRSGLKLKAAFALKGVDPFDVLGIVPSRIPGWAEGKEATEKQIAYLARQNIDAVGMNSGHASQLISEIIERSKGRCQFKGHQGKLWTEVPWAYRQWCLKQSWLRQNVREEILQSLRSA